ncbi:glycosyltransferase [Halochromatium glycolicum]|uniref:Glycosyltransferase subfamily 4-like N-terminal domain-containing protein n=1 Tax=Halochromatium glycolicum TaxID=85075 RepID=A0AAJ0XC36_9GAMM|nr:glycosyltransferase [Halochromatium glycolicum]MBK1706983.1 hypothetical protein [Halochromatium glycolicum]
MRIAIVHFHLQTGGVTRVIEHACRALALSGHEVAVLSGELPPQPQAFPARVKLVPALSYEERREPLGPSALREEMTQAATEALGAAPDLWHVHNHCLGKNLALPDALFQLAESGQRLLLQPHDFAEDGRPALYRRMLETLSAQDSAALSARLYPLAPQIHYATLNARDLGFLGAAGIPAQQLHELPNAVALASPAASGSPTGSPAASPAGSPIGSSAASPAPSLAAPRAIPARSRLWLYPTRAIRRKNLGELLFWAAVAGPEDRFGATQAPQNPLEQPRYQRWVALAEELALPVDFELGARTDDFGALLASSHALITTSVGEGFGLAFLEPWLIDRPLAGRELPEITGDFTANGIDLSGLYRRLPVPLDWLDAEALRRRLDQALAITADAYRRPRDRDDLDRAWGAATDSAGRIDLGRLDEEAQAQVLRRVRADPSAPSALDATSPPLADGPELIARNRALVEHHYLLEGYRHRLEAIYQSLLAAPSTAIGDQADGEALIAQFQAPERLWLLRT